MPVPVPVPVPVLVPMRMLLMTVLRMLRQMLAAARAPLLRLLCATWIRCLQGHLMRQWRARLMLAAL